MNAENQSPIRIAADGTWYFNDSEMFRLEAVSFLASRLNRSDGGYAITLGPQTLPILVEGDAQLFNPYHVIAVNPEKYPDINYEGAQKFIEWITSPETQAKIAAFTEPKSGLPLFFPDAVK